MARMRDDPQPEAMFSYVSVQQRVRATHPLRAIRALVDEVLRDMSRQFDGLYARLGRPSVPPDRLLNQGVGRSFFGRVVERVQGLMSDEHFTVAGTLVAAWASQNSFQRKDGGLEDGAPDFRGQQRKSDAHASTTDPDARLYRKSNGVESCLPYLGHVLIENCHGLIADVMATVAGGYGEREAATVIFCRQWERGPARRRTVGADKDYDVVDLSASCAS